MCRPSISSATLDCTHRVRAHYQQLTYLLNIVTRSDWHDVSPVVLYLTIQKKTLVTGQCHTKPSHQLSRAGPRQLKLPNSVYTARHFEPHSLLTSPLASQQTISPWAEDTTPSSAGYWQNWYAPGLIVPNIFSYIHIPRVYLGECSTHPTRCQQQWRTRDISRTIISP